VYKPPANEFQRAVENFKREFLALTLAAHSGNRSRAARALGVQRTYFVRLIRQFDVGQRVPAASVRRPVPQAR
jgi:DNA-binding NtrC family response regulator